MKIVLPSAKFFLDLVYCRIESSCSTYEFSGFKRGKVSFVVECSVMCFSLTKKFELLVLARARFDDDDSHGHS